MQTQFITIEKKPSDIMSAINTILDVQVVSAIDTVVSLNSIDPYIRDLISLMNQKGLVTEFCCASLGKSANTCDITGHSVTPYVQFLADGLPTSSDQITLDFIEKISNVTVRTKICSYPVSLSHLEATCFDDRLRYWLGLNDLFLAPDMYPKNKTVKNPKVFLRYWKKRWINTLYKIVEEL